jgi:hypothetical protein
MNKGLSAPGTPLTAREIADARASRLFKLFSSQQSPSAN